MGNNGSMIKIESSDGKINRALISESLGIEFDTNVSPRRTTASKAEAGAAKRKISRISKGYDKAKSEVFNRDFTVAQGGAELGGRSRKEDCNKGSQRTEILLPVINGSAFVFNAGG